VQLRRPRNLTQSMKVDDEHEALPNVGTKARDDGNPTVRLEAGSQRSSTVVPTQRFEDRGEIARGGMSSVRRVFDRLVMREVAMKVLAPTRDIDELTRFVEEAQITGQLEHPNIVPIHDIEMDDHGLPTRFTMKIVRGDTLNEHVLALGPEGAVGEQLERLLQAFLRVCDAVSFAHSRGVIHRDLKPSNIMVATHGQVYVMDWGVALLRDDERVADAGRISQIRASTDTQPEALGSLTGTPAYMAPEQARGEIADVDERTDVYGLGGILHFLLTRRAPHEAATSVESLQLAKLERSIVPDASPDATLLGGEQLRPPPMLCRITTRALAFSPADRYQTVEELKHDIEAFLRGGGWFAQQFFAAGTTIVQEGDIAEAAYIVIGGTCDLYKLGPVSGDEVPAPRWVCELGPGDVFGETAIFTSSTRTATIVAKTDVTVIVVTRAALERELDRSEWLRTFVRAVAQRFVELDRQLTQITTDAAGAEPH